MEYRRLGQTGIKISELALGGWTTFGDIVSDKDLAKNIITLAYDNGINFFDMADVYARGRAEELMGAILREFPRHTLVLASKVFWPMSDDINDRGLSRKHLFESIDKSLRRIGTDYLDLYFCHRHDPDTPLEETIRAMDDLIHQGKILYWGTSEWPAEHIQAAVDLCGQYNLYKPVVEQPQYSMLVRSRFERSILPVAKRNGMGLVIFSPLASGLLTGKYDDSVPADSRLARIDWLRDAILKEDTLETVRRLKPIADELGITRAQLAIAWTLRQPGVTCAITGATKLRQLEDTLQAVEIELDDDVSQRINAIVSPVAQ